MRTANKTINGGYTTFKNGAYYGYTTGQAAFRDIVTNSGIIVGNHKDPNNWGYDVTFLQTWSGKKTQQYFSGAKNLFEYVGWCGTSSDEPYYPNWTQRSIVYNMALERLNSKVRGDLDLGIALAEIGSTIRMTKSLGSVLTFAKGFRGLGTTKDLANGWLQWQYGWKPLLSDVFGVADESIRVVLSRIQRVKGTAKLAGEENVSRKKQVFNLANTPTLARGQRKEACTICMELEVLEWDPARWSSLNPVSLAWELIPYSFVVDWFLDVGSYLRNLETALLYNTAFRSGYVSELFVYDGSERTVVSGYHPSYYYPGNYGYMITAEAKVIRRRQFSRAKLTSYPLPRKPTFRVDLSSTRLLSAAALLRQLL